MCFVCYAYLLQLQTAFEKVSQELAQTKQALASAQQKEEKSAVMLSELTSVCTTVCVCVCVCVSIYIF